VRTLVFIPAWNEEGSIAAVIAGVRETLPDADVLVVDDGSGDETAARARAAGALVAVLPFNQGVGAAQQTGYMYGLREGYEVCAHLDADGQHLPGELARLIAEIEADRADMVVGSRYRDRGAGEGAGPEESEGATDDYRATLSRRTGQHVFRLMVSLSTRKRFTDTTSGMRAVNRKVMALFAARYSPEFAEVESVQQAVLSGMRVEELQVRMLERAEGRSFLTPLRSLYYIFKTMVVLLVGQFRPRLREGEGR
jgi:glycosyltransferase involved in cell wall biosynthesis